MCHLFNKYQNICDIFSCNYGKFKNKLRTVLMEYCGMDDNRIMYDL